MSAKLSLAILGAGIFAKEAHVPGLATLGDTIALKAVYSRSAKSAKELADEARSLLGPASASLKVYHDADPANSLDVLLARPDIDAVIIILPITTQPDIIIKALKAGKHVISEKPVAPDVASGLTLIKTYLSDYKPKGLIWRVAENFEAEPGIRAIGQAIRDGKIGKVTHFAVSAEHYLTKDNKYYNTPWRTIPDYQGGFLLDGGVHQAAAIRIMLPDPLKSLSGFASLNIDWLAPLDTITTTIQTTGGAHGTFTMSFALPAKSLSAGGYKIAGTKGQISTADEGGKLKVTLTNANGEVEVTKYNRDGVALELASFVSVAKGAADDGLGDPFNALKDVALLQAAFNSHGKPIDLEELVKS